MLFPDAAVTKRDVIAYYRAIAGVLLPHIGDRALTLARFPAGVDAHGWYQVRCPGRPSWLRTIPVSMRRGETIDYCAIDDEAGLVWAANAGGIELHPFLWRAARPDEHDVVVFDLDPAPGAGLAGCAHVALALRDALESQGLASWPKTSGWKGLHVYVPVRPVAPSAARGFARAVSETAARDLPELVTIDSRYVERHGRVLIDWRQNDPRRSLIAPYSMRALRRPLVSTPLRWAEVERIRDSRAGFVFGPDDVRRRLDEHGDLFAGVLDTPQHLPA